MNILRYLTGSQQIFLKLNFRLFYANKHSVRIRTNGALAEKLGSGLQNRVDGSVTRRCLQLVLITVSFSLLRRKASAASSKPRFKLAGILSGSLEICISRFVRRIHKNGRRKNLAISRSYWHFQVAIRGNCVILTGEWRNWYTRRT